MARAVSAQGFGRGLGAPGYNSKFGVSWGSNMTLVTIAIVTINTE